MKNIFTLIFLFSINVIGFSQYLKISDSTKVKLLNTKSFFETVLAENKKIEGNNCCDYQVFKGNIISVNNDSINMKLTEVNVKKHIDITQFDYELLFPVSSNEKKLAIKDIYYINYFKSEKSFNRKNNFIGIGGLLLLTGTVTALNNFFVKDKTNKRALLLSGGIQFGVGIVFLSFTGSKRYYLKNEKETWHFVD